MNPPVRLPLARRRPGVLAPARALARVAALACLVAVPSLASDAGNAPLVRLKTTLGDIMLELDAERAPASVANFLDYVDADLYVGTIFHRVIDGFMIQGGGFDESFSRVRTGAPIRNEANNGLANRRYTIAMARTNAPHSATSQFFINTVDNPNLDHTAATARGWGYAVFGRVIEGHDVVDAISRVPTGAGGPFSRDAPRESVVIERAERVIVQPPAAEAGGSDGLPPETPASALPADGETTGAADQVLIGEGAETPTEPL